jgi:cyclophilin family peptidyl-prolyl cis-trans isomerase
MMSCALLAVVGLLAAPTHVRFATNLGNIDVTLRPDAAPKTVANFLDYVNRGAYDQSIFHRLVPGFVLQGGGYFTAGDNLLAIPAGSPVVNEFKLSNTRGTVAMAKLGTDPNSAVDEFFFNLVDNSKTLDPQNGGFTVFAQVSDDASLAVMDQIAGQQVVNVDGNIFSTLPVVGYAGSGPILHQNFVTVNTVDTIVDPGTPDFAIAVSPQQITMTAGSRANATITVTPSNGYQGTVTLSCGPRPDFASCLFNPGQLTFVAGSTALTSTLTFVGTTAGAVFAPPATGASGGVSGFGTGSGSKFDRGTGSGSSFARIGSGTGSASSFARGGSVLSLTAGAGSATAARWAAFGFGALFLLAAAVRRSKRPLRTALGICGGVLLGAAGCGGSNSATPAGTYNLALRLSDGTLSHGVAMTVKIEDQPNPGNSP